MPTFYQPSRHLGQRKPGPPDSPLPLQTGQIVLHGSLYSLHPSDSLTAMTTSTTKTSTKSSTAIRAVWWDDDRHETLVAAPRERADRARSWADVARAARAVWAEVARPAPML